MERYLVLFATSCVAILMLLKNKVEGFIPKSLPQRRSTPLTAGWSRPT